MIFLSADGLTQGGPIKIGRAQLESTGGVLSGRATDEYLQDLGCLTGGCVL